MKLYSYHFMLGLCIATLAIVSLALAYRGFTDTKQAVLEYQKQVDDVRMAVDELVRLRMATPEDILKEIGE